MLRNIIKPGMAAAALILSAVQVSAAGFGDCALTGTEGSVKIPTVTEGTLTVAAILPSPDSFRGDSPETIDGGFEYCVAANIAHRAGLTSVVVKNVPWPALIAGQLDGFDVALSNIFITDERKKNVDFTIPYFRATSGVMVRSEDQGSITPETIGSKRIGVFLASVQDKYVSEVLKPTGEVRRFESGPDMYTALRANQIDVVIFDLSLVLPAANSSEGALKVIAQYDVGGDVGGVLPKGSAAKEGLDAALDNIMKDGTLEALVATWYSPLWGVDPKTIPAWK